MNDGAIAMVATDEQRLILRLCEVSSTPTHIISEYRLLNECFIAIAVDT